MHKAFTWGSLGRVDVGWSLQAERLFPRFEPDHKAATFVAPRLTLFSEKLYIHSNMHNIQVML